MTEGNPWDRQKHETMKAFGAFCVYRDMGPTRSIVKAGKLSLGEEVFTIGRQRYWETWSRKWDWVARALAWDDHNDHLAQLELTEEVKAMNVRHAKIAREAQDLAARRLSQMDPSQLPAHLVIRYLVDAVKLERQALGEADTIQEVQVDVTSLSDEELEVIARGSQ